MKKVKEDNITSVLKLIAPGTPIREGLESILRAKTGALLLITDNNEVIKEIVDGGFVINEDYTSSKLYELAKMDGAIVLSGDMKKILYANAQLIPEHEIQTTETGTRHRTAERTAKQTGELVISISQRRNIITIFKDNYRWEHPIRSLGVRGCDLVSDDMPYQLDLFMSEQKREKLEKMDQVVDEIRARFGYQSIQRAFVYQDKILAQLNAREHTVHPQGYFHG